MNEIRSFLKSGIRSVFFAIAVSMLQRRTARASAGRSPQHTVVTLRNVRHAERRYLAERETIFLVLIVDDEVVESLAFGWLLVRQRCDDLTTTQQYHTAFNSAQKPNITYCWLRRTNVL